MEKVKYEDGNVEVIIEKPEYGDTSTDWRRVNVVRSKNYVGDMVEL